MRCTKSPKRTAARNPATSAAPYRSHSRNPLQGDVIAEAMTSIPCHQTSLEQLLKLRVAAQPVEIGIETQRRGREPGEHFADTCKIGDSLAADGRTGKNLRANVFRIVE